MKKKYSNFRGLYLLVSVLISLGLAYWFGGRLVFHEKPAEYINVLFSLMAASVFAVASIVGDPSKIRGNWRLSREDAKQALKDIKELFYFFWLCILIIAVSITAEISRCNPLDITCAPTVFTHQLFLGLSVFGFMMSLVIPKLIWAILNERLDLEIESRDKN